MKKFISIIAVLFMLIIPTFAKQFCVKINCYCYRTNNSTWGCPTVHTNVEDEINKYLNKGYKLIAITSEIETNGYGSHTICYYCIFDDGK